MERSRKVLKELMKPHSKVLQAIPLPKANNKSQNPEVNTERHGGYLLSTKSMNTAQRRFLSTYEKRFSWIRS